jgi:L-alanine-DL-glutamate epimerase-like enolase superfamily enzyme
VTGAVAAVDIALWDLKGKAFRQPIYKLLGGAWRTRIPFYASIGGNAARDVDGVVKTVEARLKAEQPSAIKIRWDGTRSEIDRDIAGDIAKARGRAPAGGRRLPVGVRRQQSLFDRRRDQGRAGARGSRLRLVRGARRVLPSKAMGEVAQRLDITVSAGEQSYTLQSVAALIDSGVRMVQPDIVKMGGVTGLMQCAALCHAHGVEFVPHQTQPAIGNAANLHVLATYMHATKAGRACRRLVESGGYLRQRPQARRRLPGRAGRPGLGLVVDEAMLAHRRVDLPDRRPVVAHRAAAC